MIAKLKTALLAALLAFCGSAGAQFTQNTGYFATGSSSSGGSGTPGGSSGDIQYNNGGAFGGITPGTGCATWLATPSSANLAACLTDETGTGSVVLSASPTFTGTITAAAANFSGNVTAANLAAAGTLTDGNICTYTSSGTSVGCTLNTYAELLTAISDLNSASRTYTNVTYDTQGTGNVFKMLDTIQLTHPHNCDGTGATISTTATDIDYGRATYSNSADQTANYCEYRITVPFDLDTGTEWSARVQFRLGNTDTGTHRYVLSTVTQADSSPAAGTPATAINLDFAGDASGASLDIESVGFTTLTGWAATMTADRLLVIRLARDGNATEDGSTVNSTVMNLVLKYGRSQ